MLAWVVAIVAIVAVAAIGIAIWSATDRRRTERLQRRFGHEEIRQGR